MNSSSPASITPSTLNAEWAIDPRPIYHAVNAIIGQNSEKQMISDLVKLIVSYIKNEYMGSIFSAKEWETFCGKVSPAPALPHNIENIWQSQCPAFLGKKVYETHMLVYLPTIVNEKPLTLKSLGEIAKRYFPATN